jgi:hypothetical protein
MTTGTSLDRYSGVSSFTRPLPVEVQALFKDIDAALRDVRDQRRGPYGAIEMIMHAMCVFAEDWDREQADAE